MLDIESQKVLRCGRCNKPFDKESTLKRHGYYCRSQRLSSATRPRSCTACASAKVRCDNRQPECSRCSEKAVKCRYPASGPQRAESGIKRSNTLLKQRRKFSQSSPSACFGSINLPDASSGIDSNFELAQYTPDAKLSNLVIEQFELESNVTDFLDTQTYVGNSQDESAWWPFRDGQSLNTTPRAIETRASAPFLIPSIPAQPTSILRLFTPRTTAKFGAQRSANLILHTFKSYPLMVLRQNSLPPFIHPSMVSDETENNDMEPLTNCLNLVHMLSSRVRGNRKLFWKNVRMECERFCAEYLQFNRWELVAIMQALAIYICVRLDEGETEHNNLDSLLVTTVAMIATQFNSKSSKYDTFHDHDVNPSWKEWIFEESIRRLCIVYQVLDMLVFFEPAALCDLQTDLILAPLPAKKQLWEAGDEQVWKDESKRESSMQTIFGLASNGELVVVDQGKMHGSDAMLLSGSLEYEAPSRLAVDWGEWCSGMDSFGGLVMLAASLVN